MTDDLDAIAARAYTEAMPDLWIEDRVEEWIAPHIAKWCRGRVLDLGWGTGTMGKALLRAGVELDVVEGSAGLIAKAGMDLAARLAWNRWQPRFHLSTFEDFEPDEPYDTVLALFVLEHVADPMAVLKRIAGWLKPEGRVIVAVPNARSVHRRVGSILSGDLVDTPSARDLAVGHRRVYTLSRLAAEVAATVGPVQQVAGWFHKPVNNARMVDWPPELLDALCQVGWDGDPDQAANIIVVAKKL